MTFEEALQACAGGTMPRVKSSTPIKGATSNIGHVSVIKDYRGYKGVEVVFPGVGYGTWFHASDSVDGRSRYMRDLEIIQP